MSDWLLVPLRTRQSIANGTHRTRTPRPPPVPPPPNSSPSVTQNPRTCSCTKERTKQTEKTAHQRRIFQLREKSLVNRGTAINRPCSIGTSGKVYTDSTCRKQSCCFSERFFVFPRAGFYSRALTIVTICDLRRWFMISRTD